MVQASGKYLIVALAAVLSVACLVTGSSVDVSLFYLFILRELFAFELTFFFKIRIKWWYLMPVFH